MHTHTHTQTYARIHKKQSKEAYDNHYTAIVTQLPTLGCSKSWASNPVQVSQIETTVPQRPHIARQGKDSYFQVPIDATAGWAVSPFDTRSPFNS